MVKGQPLTYLPGDGGQICVGTEEGGGEGVKLSDILKHIRATSVQDKS